MSEFSPGGVRLVSGSERITIDNTLDERLHLLEEQVRYFHIAVVKGIAYSEFPNHRCYLRSAMTYLGPTRIASSIPETHI